MLKFGSDRNWANEVLGLRQAYNLPLNDNNIKNMGYSDWRHLVNNTIRKNAFLELSEMSSTDAESSHLAYNSLKISEYICKLNPQCARIMFKTIKYYLAFPFCKQYDETTNHSSHPILDPSVML